MRDSIKALIQAWQNQEDVLARVQAVGELSIIAANPESHQIILEEGVLPSLINLLRSSSIAEQVNSVGLTSILAENPSNHPAIMESGVFQACVPLLESPSSDVQMNVKKLLLELIKVGDSNAIREIEADVIPFFVRALTNTDLGIQSVVTVAMVIFSDNPALHEAIIEGNGISALLHVLNSAAEPPTQKNAAVALCRLAQKPDNHARIIQVIPELVRILNTSSDIEMHNNISVALGELAENPKNHETIIRAQGIEALVRRFAESSDALKRALADTLYKLSKNPETHPFIRMARAIPILVDVLKRPSNIFVQINASVALAELSENPKNHAAMLETDIVSAVTHVFRNPENVTVQKNLLFLFRHLIELNSDNAVLFKDASMIPDLVRMLQSNKLEEEGEDFICILIGILYGFAQNPINRKMMVTGDVLPELIRRLNTSRCLYTQKNAASTLFLLAHESDNHQRMQKAGVIPSLVKALDGKEDLPAIAVCTLEWLADSKGCHVVMKEAGVIKALIQLLEKDNDVTKLHATHTLCSLAQNWENHGAIVAIKNAIPTLLKVFTDSRNPDVRENVMLALVGLAQNSACDSFLGPDGGIPVLISALSGANPEIQSIAVVALARIAKNDDFHSSLVEGGVMDILYGLLERTDVDPQVQTGAAILLSKLSPPVINFGWRG